MVPVFREQYVQDVLREAAGWPQGLSRNDFYRVFRRDVAAGFQPEVDEAAHRYFTKRRTPVHGPEPVHDPRRALSPAAV
jgi:hypothetical protein